MTGTNAHARDEAQTAQVTELVRDYLAPLTPGKVLERFLEASFNTEVTSATLAKLVETNPLYAHYLQKLDILKEKVKQWQEETPKEEGTARITQFIITLLGPAVTRNAILSTWITRRAGPGLPRKDGVPFTIAPRTQLKYALVAFDYAEDNKLANRDLAYLSGFCFDWMAALVEKKGGAIKSEKKYIDEIWATAILSSRVAYELAAIPKNFKLSRYAFSATMMAFLGRFLMVVSFPKNWRDLVKHCGTHGPNAFLAMRILEGKRFAFTHAEAGSLCAGQLQMLKPAEPAIRFYQEPYLLKTKDPKSSELAAIVQAAIRITERGNPKDLPKDIMDNLKGLLTAADIERAYNHAVGKKSEKGA